MILFDTVSELISKAELEGKTISTIALHQSALDAQCSEDEIYNKMRDTLQVMRESAEKGLEPGLKSESGLSGGMAQLLKKKVDAGENLSGSFLGEVIYSALAVSEFNACMGKIVAAPTAGSSGIIPGCLLTLEKFHKISEDKIVMGLINASAIGMVIAKNASISGAEGGCQAECGSAAAMAASAMVEIMGGSPEACGHAAAQAIKSVMGLVCDPVAGLVEEPCVIRNAACASVALTAAELALAGIKSIIPVDEVIAVMGAVGRCLPESLRETSLGGIAVSESAKAICRNLQTGSNSGSA